MQSRRTFLKVLGSATIASLAGLPPERAIADAAQASQDEFFIFLHADGGWDVTLWADPRNELKGLVHPASTDNTDSQQLRHWKDVPLGGSRGGGGEDDRYDRGGGGGGNERSFELVKPQGNVDMVFGPGIGDLLDVADRLTVVNGISMNTVAHPDGKLYSTTGRHPTGDRPGAPSVNTMLANELGREQLLPNVSIGFPSAYVGDGLDGRVAPLSMEDMASITKTLARTQVYESADERDRVTIMLSEEARDLAKKSAYPRTLSAMALQYDGLRRMLGTNFENLFNPSGLRSAHPELKYNSRFTSAAALNAAFGLEAIKKNLVRCVSFMVSGYDTHGSNYRQHGLLLQDTFDLVAQILKSLDGTPHPTKQGAKLADHTHIMVVSEFCRTPQINLGKGRDHYPNNSCLVVSPRFKGGLTFGKSDKEQLLPTSVKFPAGDRAVTPSDVLATFVSAFGIEPSKYVRDGEVVKELLAT